jgi:Tfp pilus assembly protein PilN
MIEQEPKKGKQNNIFKVLTIILALLVVMLCFLLFRTQNTTAEKVEGVEVQNLVLQQELDSLLQEYERIKLEYGELNNQLTNRDSAIMQQAQEIQRLIATQGDYRTIKKKLELLQNQGKEYVRMLDSLYVVNQQLTVENNTIKEQVVKLTGEKEILSQEKEDLTEKVTTAAKMKAYGISLKAYSVKGISKKETATDKARKVKVLTVTFSLAANDLAEAGELELYCRIALPDGRILAVGSGDAYSFINQGQRLQYTIRKNITYAKSEQTVSMSWNLREDDEAIAGVYNAQIFTSTDYLGQANLILK